MRCVCVWGGDFQGKTGVVVQIGGGAAIEGVDKSGKVLLRNVVRNKYARIDRRERRVTG